ncbi:MAG: FtsW/RodA/SpoVE family cell cycle protein [Patescibacteria group bacterium]
MKITAQKSRRYYYLVLGILAFGLITVYSASPLYSQRFFKDPIYIAKLQLVWTLAGLALFILVSLLSQNFLKSISKGLFVASLVALSFLSFTSIFFPCSKATIDNDIAFCLCKNGARRWIYLNPLPLPQLPFLGTLGFQATDFAKLAFVLYMPSLLESKMFLLSQRKNAKRKYEPFVYFFGFSFLMSLLILSQPNMSNAVLIIIIAMIIYFISGADLKPPFVLVPVFVLVGIAFILISPYRRERFETLFNPGNQSELKESYQSEQILIGLGSGGAFGVGVGQSKQKAHYTPEIIGDSIFAVVGEEMGFLGSLIVVFGFGFLAFEMIKISSNAVSLYEKMVGAGVCAWIFFQYLINLYATVNLIPFTGMPIPFISYGGSSMVFALAGLGLVSNIYRRQDN